MADVKIRDLDSAGSVADTDIIEITVDPGGTPASKKATVAQIRAGVLPSGTNGGVLALVGGVWQSTGAGSAGQHLKSNGSGAPTWETPAAVPSPAGSDPEPLGSVDPGSASTYARADHVHPMPSASDVGAIAAPGSPANGAVLARVGSAWLASAAGTARQILTSAGAGTPTWGVDTLPLTQRAVDGASSAVSVCATIAHDLSTGGGAAGIGARCVLQARNAASALTDAAAIDGVLTTATAGSEVGALDLYVRSGGALVRFARFAPGGNTHGVTTAVTQYQGGARVPERSVSTNTTLDAQDEVVFVVTTGGAVTLTLPTGASGRVLAIQRVAGTADVIVQRAGSPDTIRAGGSSGLTSWTISDSARHGLIYRSSASEWVAEA